MELKTYITIIVRRKWIIVITGVALMMCVFLIAYITPSQYSATARLRIKTPIGGSPNYVDFNIWYADRLMNTYADLATSSSIREELKQKLLLPEIPKVSVNVVPSSELIKITAQAKDPNQSAKIANTLAQIIVNHSQELSDQSKIASEDFLNERKSQVSDQLDQAQKEYEQLIAPVAEDQARIANLNKLIDQDHQMYVTLLDNYEQSVLKEVGPELLTPLENQMKQMQLKIIQEQNELEKLNFKVSENLTKMDIAKRTVELKQNEYSTIMSLLDQSRITDLIRENTYALPIIDPAIPPELNSNSSHILIYIIGFILSMATAVFIAFLVDNLDNRLITSDQIISATGLDLLGKIPSSNAFNTDYFWNNIKTQVKKTRYININLPGLNLNNSRRAYWEAIRRLRINICRYTKAKTISSLIFCSTVPREGKSTIISNLAKELAISGKNIILVDTDMRKPSIHKYFNLPNRTGLSNYLTGNADLYDLIRETKYGNLDILTSGPPPYDPEALLRSPCLKELIDQLESNYDLVLFDAPALLATSDVDEIATIIDGTVLVVQRGRANASKVQAVINQLNNFDAKPIGLIINRAESNGSYNYYELKTLPVRNGKRNHS